MGKKGHLTFEKRALNIRRGSVSAPHAPPPLLSPPGTPLNNDNYDDDDDDIF